MARLLDEGAAVLAGRVATVALALAASVVVARTAGVDGRGVFSLATVTPQVIVMLISLGLLNANVVAVQRDAASAPAALGNGLLVFGLGASVAISALLLSQGFLLGTILRGLSARGLIWIALALYPVAFHRLAISLLHATRRIPSLIVQEIAHHGARLVALLITPSFLAYPEGIPVAVLVSAIVSALLDAHALWRANLLSTRIDFAELTRSLRFGIRYQAAEVVDVLQGRLDYYVVSFFSGVSQLGIYATSRSIADGLLLPSTALGLPLYPRLVTMPEDRARLLTARAARAVLYGGVVIGAGVALLSGGLIQFLYGAEFRSSRVPLLIIIAGIIPFAICRVLNAYLLSRGKPGTIALLSAMGFASTLVAAVALVPTYGPIGAAIAASLAFALVTALSSAVFCRVSELPWSALVVPHAGDISGLREWVASVVARLRGRGA